MPVSVSELPTGIGVAAAVFAVCALLGWLVDRLLYRVISSKAESSGWIHGRDLAAGVQGFAIAIGILLGARLAIGRAGLESDIVRIAASATQVVSILVATAFIARAFGRLVRSYTLREGSHLPSTSIFVNLARGIVWVLGLISLLASLGVSIAPLITALGVGGLAVGLALQPTLENVFSGIQVLASRQIEPGDLIRLETGEEGEVVDVTWRNTTIRTPANDIIIVPNAMIGRSRITNFSTLSCEHVLVVPVTVHADADLTAIERVMRTTAEEVAREVQGVVKGATPRVRFANITAEGIQVNAALRVRTYGDRASVRHEFIGRLHTHLAEEGLLQQLTASAGTSAS